MIESGQVGVYEIDGRARDHERLTIHDGPECASVTIDREYALQARAAGHKVTRIATLNTG